MTKRNPFFKIISAALVLSVSFTSTIAYSDVPAIAESFQINTTARQMPLQMVPSERSELREALGLSTRSELRASSFFNSTPSAKDKAYEEALKRYTGKPDLSSAIQFIIERAKAAGKFEIPHESRKKETFIHFKTVDKAGGARLVEITDKTDATGRINFVARHKDNNTVDIYIDFRSKPADRWQHLVDQASVQRQQLDKLMAVAAPADTLQARPAAQPDNQGPIRKQLTAQEMGLKISSLGWKEDTNHFKSHGYYRFEKTFGTRTSGETRVSFLYGKNQQNLNSWAILVDEQNGAHIYFSLEVNETAQNKFVTNIDLDFSHLGFNKNAWIDFIVDDSQLFSADIKIFITREFADYLTRHGFHPFVFPLPGDVNIELIPLEPSQIASFRSELRAFVHVYDFARLDPSDETEDDIELVNSISDTESENIFKILVENGFLTKSGNVTAKLTSTTRSNDLDLPRKYIRFKTPVLRYLRRVQNKDKAEKKWWNRSLRWVSSHKLVISMGIFAAVFLAGTYSYFYITDPDRVALKALQNAKGAEVRIVVNDQSGVDFRGNPYLQEKMEEALSYHSIKALPDLNDRIIRIDIEKGEDGFFPASLIVRNDASMETTNLRRVILKDHHDQKPETLLSDGESLQRLILGDAHEDFIFGKNVAALLYSIGSLMLLAMLPLAVAIWVGSRGRREDNQKLARLAGKTLGSRSELRSNPNFIQQIIVRDQNLLQKLNAFTKSSTDETILWLILRGFNDIFNFEIPFEDAASKEANAYFREEKQQLLTFETQDKAAWHLALVRQSTNRKLINLEIRYREAGAGRWRMVLEGVTNGTLLEEAVDNFTLFRNQSRRKIIVRQQDANGFKAKMAGFRWAEDQAISSTGKRVFWKNFGHAKILMAFAANPKKNFDDWEIRVEDFDRKSVYFIARVSRDPGSVQTKIEVNGIPAVDNGVQWVDFDIDEIAQKITLYFPDYFTHTLKMHGITEDSYQFPSQGDVRVEFVFLKEKQMRSELRSTVKDSLEAGQFVVTAEVINEKQTEKIRELTREGWIDAGVIPDLPIISNPATLLQALPNSIATIAANARFRLKILNMILKVFDHGAQGVLVVSGSWISRLIAQFLKIDRLLPMNSFKILHLLRQLRQEGLILRKNSFFAVENPLIGTPETQADRFAKKADEGAEAIFTQPAILWNRFEAWWNEISARGLADKTPVIIGIPVVTSSKNLRFWFQLTGHLSKFDYFLGKDPKDPEALALLDLFRQKEKESDAKGLEPKNDPEFIQFRKEWTAELIRKVRRLPGSRGIHLMSLSGPKDFKEILKLASVSPVTRFEIGAEKLIGEIEQLGIQVDFEKLLVSEKNIKAFREALQALKTILIQVSPVLRPKQITLRRITYAQHFEPPVSIKHIYKSSEFELAIDLKPLQGKDQFDRELFIYLVNEALWRSGDPQDVGQSRVQLSTFSPLSKSLIWQFNRLFWQHVNDFMKALGRDYRESINGSPDSTPELVQYNAHRFLDQLEALEQAGKLAPGERLAYVEIGVASVDYARLFVDFLRDEAEVRGKKNLLEHVTYVMADSSDSILKQAVEHLGEGRNGIHFDYLKLDAQEPLRALDVYRGKILRIHVTNIFDNLPTDVITKINGKLYQALSRVIISNETLGILSRKYQLDRAKLLRDLKQLDKAGVQNFLESYRKVFQGRTDLNPDERDKKFYQFWYDLYGNVNEPQTGLKTEELYEEIVNPDKFNFLQNAEKSGAILADLAQSVPENVKFALSNVAIDASIQLVDLLHSDGVLEITDIVTNDLRDYRNRAHRPNKLAKYDGSAVEWVNGALLRKVLESARPDAQMAVTSLEKFGKKEMSLVEISKNGRSELRYAPAETVVRRSFLDRITRNYLANAVVIGLFAVLFDQLGLIRPPTPHTIWEILTYVAKTEFTFAFFWALSDSMAKRWFNEPVSKQSLKKAIISGSLNGIITLGFFFLISFIPDPTGIVRVLAVTFGLVPTRNWITAKLFHIENRKSQEAAIQNRYFESLWLTRAISILKNSIIQILIPLPLRTPSEAIATQFFQQYYAWAFHERRPSIIERPTWITALQKIIPFRGTVEKRFPRYSRAWAIAIYSFPAIPLNVIEFLSRKKLWRSNVTLAPVLAGRSELRLINQTKLNEEAVGIANEISLFFDKHRLLFNQITDRGLLRFENWDWEGSAMQDRLERLGIYRKIVDQTYAEIKGSLQDLDGSNLDLWNFAKQKYADSLTNRYETDTAMTFFNSIARRFLSAGVGQVMFSPEEIEQAEKEADAFKSSEPIFRTYARGENLKTVFQTVLEAYQFKEIGRKLFNGSNIAYQHIGYNNLAADAEKIAGETSQYLIKKAHSDQFHSIEVLKPLFFRNKSVYIVAKIVIDPRYPNLSIPLVIRLRNEIDEERTGVFVDRVFIGEDLAGNIFTFSRSGFFVKTDQYRELIQFIYSLVPRKDIYELYWEIGFYHHARSKFYSHLTNYLRHSGKKFIPAEQTPEDLGTVMITFTLDGFDNVLKVVRSVNLRTGAFINRDDVWKIYRNVDDIDRAGRLMGGLKFEELKFHKSQFDDGLWAALEKDADPNLGPNRSDIVIEGDFVIFKRLAVQKKGETLSHMLRHERDLDRIIRTYIDFGYFIKELANAGFFYGDYVPKNLVVSSYGRVLGIDFDQIEPIVNLLFKNFYQFLEENKGRMKGSDSVFDGIPVLFPDKEFSKLIPDFVLPAFLEHHADLITVEFWNDLKKRLQQNHILDIVPAATSKNGVGSDSKSELRSRQVNNLDAIISDKILSSFMNYVAEFGMITARAKKNFEHIDLRGIHRDFQLRLELYKKVITVLESEISKMDDGRLNNVEIWKQIKEQYSDLIDEFYNADLAETFFNSIARRFLAADIGQVMYPPEESDLIEERIKADEPAYKQYLRSSTTDDVIRRVLSDYSFQNGYEDFGKSVSDIAGHLNKYLGKTNFESIEILKPVFFRNKSAYLIGRVTIDSDKDYPSQIPIVIQLRNQAEAKEGGRQLGIFVRNVFLGEELAGNVFTFSRSGFFVDTSNHRELIQFIHALIPRKDPYELYWGIGLHNHARTKFYEHLFTHVRSTGEKFVDAVKPADGQGRYMVVFTLPGFDNVFKFIRGRDYQGAWVNKQKIKDQYEYVDQMNRGGWLLGGLRFGDVKFPTKMFSAELLQIIREESEKPDSEVKIENDFVIFKLLLVQKKIRPLKSALAETGDPNKQREIIQKYGSFIKGLALSGILYRDLKLNNVGLTTYGRPVGFDFDDLVSIETMDYRSLAQLKGKHGAGEELEAEMNDNDVFPDDMFRKVMSDRLYGELQDAHPELVTADAWNGEKYSRIMAKKVYQAFEKYISEFYKITARAKERFDSRDWSGAIADAHERFKVRNLLFEEIKERVEEILKEAGKSESHEFWHLTREKYFEEVAHRYDADLAITFFYSLMRRILSEKGITVEYSDDGIVDHRAVSLDKSIYTTHAVANPGGLQELMKKILLAAQFKSPFYDLDGQSAEIVERLKREAGFQNIDSIEMLHPVFFRNKGAYLIGRIRHNNSVRPFALALINGEDGIVVDAVLTDEKELGKVFSYTRSNFHVDVEGYRELIDFLQTGLPRKKRAALYSAIGFIQPAKIELIKEVRAHIRETSEQFVLTSGTRGNVMEAFTLPTFPYVFKIIINFSTVPSHEFKYPPGWESMVSGKYKLAHETDRVGRMLDTSTFKNLKFPKKLFSKDLLEALRKRSPGHFVETEREIIFKTVYVQRKVTPLDVYLSQEHDPEEIEKVIIDFGRAIKDLAVAGLFTGDIQPKNFGITEYGRIVYYDYDEMGRITEFEYVTDYGWYAPPPGDDSWGGGQSSPQFDSDWRDEYIHHKISMQKIKRQLNLPESLKDMFLKHHGEIFTIEFWNQMKEQISSGKILDWYPYSDSARLESSLQKIEAAKSELRKINSDASDFSSMRAALDIQINFPHIVNMVNVSFKSVLKLFGKHQSDGSSAVTISNNISDADVMIGSRGVTFDNGLLPALINEARQGKAVIVIAPTDLEIQLVDAANRQLEALHNPRARKIEIAEDPEHALPLSRQLGKTALYLAANEADKHLAENAGLRAEIMTPLDIQLRFRNLPVFLDSIEQFQQAYEALLAAA